MIIHCIGNLPFNDNDDRYLPRPIYNSMNYRNNLALHHTRDKT